ncbi:hypothetical protein [Desulfoluna sp.]|uniref:hypothetical protein n=1 Tax=Desulfoluna sp. TaxID=2045199 RepID=UPI00261A7FD5|nr:hypothetical protein [Desulfoluna sp.]
MHRSIHPPRGLLPLLMLLAFSACTTIPTRPPPSDGVTFAVKGSPTLLERHAPAFVIEHPEKRHNLIGSARAEIRPDHSQRIYVTPDKATIYAEKRAFATSKERYTNLIYRVHFENIPGGFFPYHLGKGKNVGLIVVVTLNSRNLPILYTSVHTCGCYLAFVPTSSLPEACFPNGWEKSRQTVHSESLPGYLDLRDDPREHRRLTILIRDDTHRVKDIWLTPGDSLRDYPTLSAALQPLATLETLPLNQGESTSFYETEGPRKGYVKGSQKPRERLLMSWWAFDWRIGEDKKLGQNRQDGPEFYTSLKPWARKASDMRDFEAFLTYWEWSL